MAASVINEGNRYTQGGVADYYTTRVGWWERNLLPASETDLVFYIDSQHERRPDLIAYNVYNSARYSWLVLQYNNIVDINEELVVGKRLLLPTPARLSTLVSARAKGGNKVE